MVDVFDADDQAMTAFKARVQRITRKYHILKWVYLDIKPSDFDNDNCNRKGHDVPHND